MENKYKFHFLAFFVLLHFCLCPILTTSRAFSLSDGQTHSFIQPSSNEATYESISTNLAADTVVTRFNTFGIGIRVGKDFFEENVGLIYTVSVFVPPQDTSSFLLSINLNSEDQHPLLQGLIDMSLGWNFPVDVSYNLRPHLDLGSIWFKQKSPNNSGFLNFYPTLGGGVAIERELLSNFIFLLDLRLPLLSEDNYHPFVISLGLRIHI